MKAIQDMFGGWNKRNIEIKVCDACEKEFEIYDLYANDEFKGRTESDICFKCKMKKEDEAVVRQVLQRKEERKNIRYERLSVLPFDLEGASLESYVPKNETQAAALTEVKKYASGELEKNTLFFQGDTGIGKTHLSYSVYQIYKNDNKSAIFIDLPSLLSSIRETYNRDSATTQDQIMKLVIDCELLVLDDIGAEYVKPDTSGFESWAADILFQIANARQGKKNIYTTNFSSKYLNQKYGMMSKRILSRLMSDAKIIKMEGKDHRLEGLS